MDSNIRMWLKHHYQSAAVSGPECKKMKFSQVMESARLQFTASVSPCLLSKAIENEFPSTTKKKVGKNRHTYVYGMEEQSTSTLQAALERNAVLQTQVEELQQRVAELEKKSTFALDQEMEALLCPDMVVYHGPDTVDHLKSFSLDAVVAEMRDNAPDALELVSQLGGCSRFDAGEGDAESEPARIARLRAVTALCTLLKGRSVKVLGLQLLLSFMLIARATSKQVKEGK